MIKSYKIIKSYPHAIGQLQSKISSNGLTQIVVFCIFIQRTFKLQNRSSTNNMRRKTIPQINNPDKKKNIYEY